MSPSTPAPHLARGPRSETDGRPEPEAAHRERLAGSLLDVNLKILEETSTQTQLAARSGDLQAGAAKAAGLAGDPKPSFWSEALVGVLFVSIHRVLARFAPDEFGERVLGILTGLGGGKGIPPDDAKEFGVAVVGVGILLVIGAARFWRYHRRAARKGRVAEALRLVTSLYIVHSARAAKLRRAGYLRIQSEARLSPFTGMTWEGVVAADGVRLVRQHLNQLATLDTQRGIDEAEYAAFAGDSLLDLLRAGLRGEVPLVVCLYAAAGLEIGSGGQLAPTWRRQAVRLCRAEGLVFAAGFPRNTRAYRKLLRALRRVGDFSADTLLELLSVWGDISGHYGIRGADHRRSFQAAFSGRVGPIPDDASRPATSSPRTRTRCFGG